jgi:benzoyl-CoA reductase/2-hydroxyglutaryl-CoA dehydratase subunit BcrC/BadD/HgdB
MTRDLRNLLGSLDVNLELHDRLEAYNTALHERTFRSATRRPAAMTRFDEAFHASHGTRVAEIADHRSAGGKSIGTFCIYVPDEIALAAGVIPIPLCGGTNWSVDYADKMFPRDICPLIRSTFGMAFSGTCPYRKLKDAVVGETTCDAKKKAWDLLGFQVLEVPQKKLPPDRELWRAEVRGFRRFMENLSGVQITFDGLREAVLLTNKRRKLLQNINLLRQIDDPPVSGLDALLVSQAALTMDPAAFIRIATELLDELNDRSRQCISAYTHHGPRVLIAGSPSPMGYAKIHFAVEQHGMRVVADETCTGMRYFRDLIDETPPDLDALLDSIADRYFSIDCSCFSPNRERVENIQRILESYRVDGVLHHILSFCHTYNIEARVVDRLLSSHAVPSLTIVTDYSYEDLDRLSVRLESFSEVLIGRRMPHVDFGR